MVERVQKGLKWDWSGQSVAQFDSSGHLLLIDVHQIDDLPVASQASIRRSQRGVNAHAMTDAK